MKTDQLVDIVTEQTGGAPRTIVILKHASGISGITTPEMLKNKVDSQNLDLSDCDPAGLWQ